MGGLFCWHYLVVVLYTWRGGAATAQSVPETLDGKGLVSGVYMPYIVVYLNGRVGE